jgi:hypothetical protein
LEKLIWAEPIEPVHQRPVIQTENPPWGYDPSFFALTDDYVDQTNELLSYETKWRLLEVAETDLKLVYFESPLHGRRYKVFHAHQAVGTLEFYGLGGEHHIIVHLNWIRFFSANAVREFLLTVATDLFSSEQERAVARQKIEMEMVDAAWQALQFSSIHDVPSSLNNDPGELDVSFSGDYTVSVNRRNNARTRMRARHQREEGA